MHLRKKVLVICFSDLARDPRVYRQIYFLQKTGRYEITALGYQNPCIDNVEFIRVESDRYKKTSLRVKNVILLKSNSFESYYWSSSQVKQAFNIVSNKKFDLIIANDLNTLPLAVKLASQINCKLLLDAHEYAPRQYDEKWSFRFFFQDYWEYICGQYLSSVDAMITVCSGISEKYKQEYGVPSSVITNAPLFQELSPSPINWKNIKMIHHGGVNRVRKIENMIRLLDRLDPRFSLDFMLLSNDNRYLQELKTIASKTPRVNFIEPVAMIDICKKINEYDIGLYMLPPNSFNCRMALPNKLFEFIQGRLAISIWPSPEMSKLVQKYSCGIVSNDFSIDSMADTLNDLTLSSLEKLKERTEGAANEQCAEKNFEKINNILESLIH